MDIILWGPETQTRPALGKILRVLADIPAFSTHGKKTSASLHLGIADGMGRFFSQYDIYFHKDLRTSGIRRLCWNSRMNSASEAGSRFQGWGIGGLFSTSSYTRNDKIGEMLDIVFDLLRKARQEGFSAEEIESARNYLQGQFPQSLETNSAKAAAYLRLIFYNLGFDYYDKYLADIQKVTAREALEAARKLLPGADYVLVAVGKAAEIRPLLAKYGTWQEKKISDPGF